MTLLKFINIFALNSRPTNTFFKVGGEDFIWRENLLGVNVTRKPNDLANVYDFW